MNPNWDFVWGGLLLSGAIMETIALHDRRSGDTLSERTRVWFRIRESGLGRIVFSAGWIIFAAWFLLHILEK